MNTREAVIDPRNGDEISLDRAVSQGIINHTLGTYVNPSTLDSVPIPTAMTAGKIKVFHLFTYFTSTARSNIFNFPVLSHDINRFEG